MRDSKIVTVSIFQTVSEEFFSETEHILIRCGESRRRRAGKRGLELKDPDPLLG